MKFTKLIKCISCEEVEEETLGSHFNATKGVNDGRKVCRRCYNRQLKRKTRKAESPKVKKFSEKQRLEEYQDYRGHKRAILGATRKYYQLVKKHPFLLREADLLLIPNYDLLWEAWSSSGYLEELTPMLTKLERKHHYSVENAQWVTFGEVGYTRGDIQEMAIIEKLAKEMDAINLASSKKPADVLTPKELEQQESYRDSELEKVRKRRNPYV